MSNHWFDEFARSVQANIDQAKNANGNDDQLQRNANSIKNLFTQFYAQRMGICSYSPRGTFLTQLCKERGEDIAAGALLLFTKRPIDLTQHDNLQGAFTAYCFDNGICSRVPSEVQTLEAMRKEWEQKFQEFRVTLTAETEVHKQLNSDGAYQLEKQGAEFKELVAKSKKDWDYLNKTYDDLLALRSPVTYWTRKAQRHFWASWAYSTRPAPLRATLLIPERN